MNNNHTRVSVQRVSEAFFTFSSIQTIMRRPIFNDVSLLSSFEDGSFDEVNGNIMYYAMLHPFTSAPVWPQSRSQFACHASLQSILASSLSILFLAPVNTQEILREHHYVLFFHSPHLL